jgi:hypothetical protein
MLSVSNQFFPLCAAKLVFEIEHLLSGECFKLYRQPEKLQGGLSDAGCRGQLD